jgi:serine acetyltransferase
MNRSSARRPTYVLGRESRACDDRVRRLRGDRATIIQSIRVGCEGVVGAGAVVIGDLAPMSTVVGVPAREIKTVRNIPSMKSWLMPELARSAPRTEAPVPVSTD